MFGFVNGAPVVVRRSPQSPVAALVRKLRYCAPLQQEDWSVVDVVPPTVVVDVVVGTATLVELVLLVLVDDVVVGRTVVDVVVSGGSVGGRQVRHGLHVSAQSEPSRHGLHSVEQNDGSRQTPIMPGALTLPGPGASTRLSTRSFCDAGTQKFPASVVAKSDGPPSSGVPRCRIVRATTPVPNAPGVRCAGQKLPSADDNVDVPLESVSGLTSSAPRNCVGSGRQSTLVPVDPTPPEHGWPSRAPPLQTPASQRGHGRSGSPVR